jgi:hypothetical protein
VARRPPLPPRKDLGVSKSSAESTLAGTGMCLICGNVQAPTEIIVDHKNLIATSPSTKDVTHGQ